MPGKAALLLSFDVAPEAIPEHDDWHTREHLPERLSIAGFLRGTRWVSDRGQPRYFVIYEVAGIEVLTSAAYLERLNNPTPWTAKMMPHYRGMRRGLCAVAGGFGAGIGHACGLVRFKPGSDADSTRRWLLEEALPAIPASRGVGSVRLFESAAAAPMTNEQRIRGADAGFDWAIVVIGYSEDLVRSSAQASLRRRQFEARGATGVLDATYRLDYSLTREEAAA
ncbi:MAG TPA: hypothetical protein VMI15_04780 [Burkholderiales bacterium]|nr:hypothetical protein [Burkholderiales bacterium]